MIEKMYKLYSPKTEFDLMFLKSILESENILYFVHNDNFGSLQMGPSIDLFNAKTIFINEKDKEKAEELLKAYLQEQITEGETGEAEPSQANTFFRKLRMIIEAFLFSWFIPDEDRYRLRNKKKDH